MVFFFYATQDLNKCGLVASGCPLVSVQDKEYQDMHC